MAAELNRTDVELIKGRSMDLLKDYRGLQQSDRSDLEKGAWELITQNLATLAMLEPARLRPDGDLVYKEAVLAALAVVNPESPNNVDAPTILHQSATGQIFKETVERDKPFAQALAAAEQVIQAGADAQNAEVSPELTVKKRVAALLAKSPASSISRAV